MGVISETSKEIFVLLSGWLSGWVGGWWLGGSVVGWLSGWLVVWLIHVGEELNGQKHSDGWSQQRNRQTDR